MLQVKTIAILLFGLLVNLTATCSFVAAQTHRIDELPQEAFSVLDRPLLPETEVAVVAQQRQFRRSGQKDKTPLNAAKVNRSVELAVEYLKSQQTGDGTWPQSHYPGDTTVLCALALLNSGQNPSAPYLQRALDNIQSNPRIATYVVSLRIMALVAADPKGQKYTRDVEKDVDWLLKNQQKDGPNAGSWNYGSSGGKGDSSNSQFALLALHEATRIGIKIPKSNWELAKQYWENAYQNRGGFGYYARNTSSYGSMTCAGISSWIIIHENLADAAGLVEGEFANCCRDNPEMDKVKTAFDWLAKNYSITGNPKKGRKTVLYYLYGLERAARLAGRRFIGANDWYRDGAKHLLKIQNPNKGNWITHGGHGEGNPLVATSFGLLFLSKGKRPIAIGKYNHGVADWDLHPKGVHYLTRRLELEWKKKLNWQTVKAENSTVDDLLEAPVLFMSGKDAIGLSAKQKETLSLYLENGGFLFAEAYEGDGCGKAIGYDKAFRELMEEIFPDSKLEPLDRAHPIWRARYKLLFNNERPLLGLQACCRTSVVYCPTNLSCYWGLDQPAIMDNAGVKKKLKERVEYCTQLGVNVVAYATGIENLKEKGETPKVVERKFDLLTDRVLVLPKLRHGGGDDDAPNAWRHVLRELEATVGLDMKTDKKMISPSFEELADHPFVFIHGRTGFSFTDEQRQAIRDSLEHGGFIFADSICASDEFTKSFRDEMNRILEKPLRPIPADHAMLTDRIGYKLDRVQFQIRDPKVAGGIGPLQWGPPRLEMGEYNGRIAVVFSPLDLSCALENIQKSQCTGYTREFAKKIGVNVVLYYLLGDE